MSNPSTAAALDIAGIIDREGTWSAADSVATIRDIASFTITAPSGQQFTVAVTPRREQPAEPDPDDIAVERAEARTAEELAELRDE